MKKELSQNIAEELIQILKKRFEKNMQRHPKLSWQDIQTKLEANLSKLWALNEMELSGGESDVVKYDNATNEFHFYDCSAESPSGRRSLCYDRNAWESRKEHKPKDNALDMAATLGISILDEAEYRELQKLGQFDTKTSSWVATPIEIRKHGGAIFCDCRYNHVFKYHNGAESYYAARGFRGSLKV